MERINIKTIVYLCAVLAVLAGYFFLYETKNETPPRKEEKIFQFKPENVERITLLKNSVKIVCEKKDNQWFIKEPVSCKADNKIINEIISQLEKAKMVEMVEKNPSDLSQFGLKIPQALKVKISTDKGREEELIIGNPVSLNVLYVYAKKARSPQVFTVYSNLKTILNKTTFDLRDKTVIYVKQDNVEKIRIKRPSLDLMLEKNQNTWQITSPVKALADKDRVSQLLEKLKKAKVKKFIDEKTSNLKPYGLVNPYIQIFLWEKGKDNPLKLLIGNKKKEDTFYARKVENSSVFLIDKDIVDSLPQKAEDIREMHILRFDIDKITKIELNYPGIKIIIDREDKDNWKIKSPVLTKADEMAIKRLLWDIKDTKLNSFLPASYLKKIEHKKPDVTISLWEKEKAHKLTIFSKGVLEKKICGKSTLHTLPFTLKDEIKKNLFVTIFDIRDRHLLNFDPLKIDKFEIKYNSNIIKVEKRGRRWKITKPSLGLADGPKVWRIIFAIKDLEFEKVIEEKVPNPSAYGFENPLIQITLWERGQKNAKIIKIRKLTNKKSFLAVSSALEGVYGINSDFVDKIPKRASEIEYRR